MEVLSVEVLTEEELTRLRREARRERCEENERLANMTASEALGIFIGEVSTSRFRAAIAQDAAAVESPLRPVPKEDVFRYEDPEVVALLHFARENGWKPVLVQFPCEPSKAFEERWRPMSRRTWP